MRELSVGGCDATCQVVEEAPFYCYTEGKFLCAKRSLLKFTLDRTALLFDTAQNGLNGLAVQALCASVEVILARLSQQTRGSDEDLLAEIDSVLALIEPAVFDDADQLPTGAELLDQISDYTLAGGDVSIAENGAPPNAYILVEQSGFLQRLRTAARVDSDLHLGQKRPFPSKFMIPRQTSVVPTWARPLRLALPTPFMVRSRVFACPVTRTTTARLRASPTRTTTSLKIRPNES